MEAFEVVRVFVNKTVVSREPRHACMGTQAMAL